MKALVIGTGYVGLTTGVCLASLGHRVTGYDLDSDKIAALQGGAAPIYEDGLEDLMSRCAERLEFTGDLPAAAGKAEIVLLAVGTPMSAEGDIDLSYLEAAARSVAPHLRANAMVVIKSTVVPGTARHIREIIAEARGGLDFSVASNPEFLREGSAVSDFLCPDRVVLGADDARSAAKLRALYAPLIDAGAPVVETSTVNAELIKYASNAMLALRIGFINNIADLCEAVSGDVETVSRAMGLDHRIGQHFLKAGPGFGGSCFPKDIRALAAIGRKSGAGQPIVEALIAENDRRQDRLVDRVQDALGSKPKGRRVAILGAAFKAGTDDLRESIVVPILKVLVNAGVEVAVYDPVAARAVKRLTPGISIATTPYEAAEGADLAVVLTEWDEIKAVDLYRLASLMERPALLDYRNLFDPTSAAAAGFAYTGIGRTMPGRPSREQPKRAATSRIAAAE